MSAEGKKKRGIAGQTKAAANPWRLNGFAPDWQARRIGCHQVGPSRSSGRVTLMGIAGGVLAERLGFPMHGSTALYDTMLAHAEDRIDRLNGNVPFRQAAE